MTDAIEHYVATGRWWVDVFLAMPDHWHAIASFPTHEAMKDVVRDWKRYVARHAKMKWQDGFFDHRLRSAQGCAEKWDYIARNPVRKGLCESPEEWPWIWTAAGAAVWGQTALPRKG